MHTSSKVGNRIGLFSRQEDEFQKEFMEDIGPNLEIVSENRKSSVIRGKEKSQLNSKLKFALAMQSGAMLLQVMNRICINNLTGS